MASKLKKFSDLAKEAWTPWEWRNHLVGHPLSLPGMKKCCLNNKYSVQFLEQQTAWGMVEHLIIRRHDNKPILPWQDKQRIKNELVGRDRVAVEVFPVEEDLVDDANVYHLWVLPNGMKLPFGLHPGWSH